MKKRTLIFVGLFLSVSTASAFYINEKITTPNNDEHVASEVVKKEYDIKLPTSVTAYDDTEQENGSNVSSINGKGETNTNEGEISQNDKINETNHEHNEATSSDEVVQGETGNENNRTEEVEDDTIENDSGNNNSHTEHEEGQQTDNANDVSENVESGENEQVGNEVEEEPTTPEEPSSPSEPSNPQPPKEESPKPVVTSDSIISAYTPVFEDLEAQANDKLNALLSEAYNEYSTKKDSGESISFAYFYNKYIGSAKELEKQTDDAFYYVYHALGDELKVNGFSVDLIVHMEEEYIDTKAERRKELIRKALNGF